MTKFNVVGDGPEVLRICSGGFLLDADFSPQRLSELAKIAVAIVTARFFSEVKLNTAYRLRDLWLLGLLVGALSVLIFPQPDLGTASFLVLIVCFQLCFIQINWKSLAMVGSAASGRASAATYGRPAAPSVSAAR